MNDSYLNADDSLSPPDGSKNLSEISTTRASATESNENQAGISLIAKRNPETEFLKRVLKLKKENRMKSLSNKIKMALSQQFI